MVAGGLDTQVRNAPRFMQLGLAAAHRVQQHELAHANRTTHGHPPQPCFAAHPIDAAV